MKVTKKELKKMFTREDIEEIAAIIYSHLEGGVYSFLVPYKRYAYTEAVKDALDYILGIVAENLA